MGKLILFATTVLCLSCESKGAEPVQPQVPAWQAPELLASGFRFTEGPAWCEDGYLLFSDLYGNKIYKWSENDGITVFLSPRKVRTAYAMTARGFGYAVMQREILPCWVKMV